MLHNGESLQDYKLKQDYYFHQWGINHNESLFDRGLQRRITSDEQESQLLKQYFNTDLIRKAIEIYKYDYQLLPLDPPWWIQELFDIKLEFG